MLLLDMPLYDRKKMERDPDSESDHDDDAAANLMEWDGGGGQHV